jgi:hypothetical protein
MRPQTALVLATILMLTVCSATSADLVTFGFVNITHNDAYCATVGECQLWVDVSNGDNQVTFNFRNDGPEACSISEVYFDDGTLLELVGIDNSDPGVYFVQYASPPDLPGGEQLDPPFEVSLGFLAESIPPPPHNGVNPLESVGIVFSLKENRTWQSVVDELNNGTLRIGIHVIDFVGGGSESFVNPEPGTLSLLGLSIALALRRR